jgi:hypothetical protein
MHTEPFKLRIILGSALSKLVTGFINILSGWEVLVAKDNSYQGIGPGHMLGIQASLHIKNPAGFRPNISQKNIFEHSKVSAGPNRPHQYSKGNLDIFKLWAHF